MTRVTLEPQASFTRRASNRAAKVAAVRMGKLVKSQPRRPIFLVGCARSGTTLLERLLGMHPDIADWSEANEVWDPSWFPWRESSAVRPPVEYDPAVFTEAWELANLSRVDEIRSTFGTYQTLTRKPVFLNKTPYHSFRIGHLRDQFPDGKLVYIRRDGRAVVNSYMTKLHRQGKLREWPASQRAAFEADPSEMARWLAVYWEATCREADERDAALGLSQSGVMLRLTYEELCAEPTETIEEICRFIGIDAGPLSAVQDAHPITNTNHKWRDDLDDRSQRAIHEAVGEALAKYGYD